jgi:glycosyltransferase involved in cell wall biosynthesis
VNVLLVHPGTQYSYQLAQQLHKRGLLHYFVTGIAVGHASFFTRLSWLPAAWQKKIKARTVAGVPGSKLRRFPIPELNALLRLRLSTNGEAVLYHRNRRFQEQIPQRLIQNADVVIGFDTSSWILIERCKRLGKPFVLDASIAHPTAKLAVFEQLCQRYPLWQLQLHAKPAQYLALELEEMASATHIVAASSFTRGTYLQHGVEAQKISVNPYGTDLTFFRSKWETASPAPGSGLRFFFFGALTARKGFPWLCKVWELFVRQYPLSTLVAAGFNRPPDGFELPPGVELVGAIHPDDRVNWFHAADVFVFPSFFEGFAQVVIEAMACGLPVITTTATAGYDVMPADGRAGFVLPPGDDEALMRALLYFAQHPEAVEPMGRAACLAVESFTWEAYGQRWQTILENVVGQSEPGNKVN